MENPIKMDDLGVPLFLETPKSGWCEPLSTYHLLLEPGTILRMMDVKGFPILPRGKV